MPRKALGARCSITALLAASSASEPRVLLTRATPRATNAVRSSFAGRRATCSALPFCACYDRDDDEAPCSEGRSFDRLVDWTQRGVDAFLPAAAREDAPQIADVLDVRRQWRGERLVVARRDMKAGELLLRLPVQRLMHAGYYKGSGNHTAPPLAAAMRQSLDGREYEFYIAPQTWLALYLMEQRRLGPASEWRVYMDLLPEEFPLPVFYQKDEWETLRGSRFFLRAKKHSESLQKQYETVEELVPGFSKNYTLDEFLWARSAISSRVFGWDLPGLPAEETEFMVPLGDMFNHRSPKQVEWIYNDTAATFDYWVREDVARGSELLISYGSKCNSGYLLHYGFALPGVSSRNPPMSTVRVALGLDASVPDRARREKWLLKKRLSDDEELAPEEFELKAMWKGDMDRMLGYARLLGLPADDFDRRVKGRNCKAFASPPRCESPLGVSEEREALRRVSSAISQAIAAYPTTMDEDEVLLPTLSGLTRSLVLLRRDEKVVLGWWQRYLTLALEMLDMSPGEIESRAEDEFGEFSPDGQYLQVTLASIVSVEAIYKDRSR